MERNKIIIRTSILAIAVNVILILFKMAAGLLSHSIAIILDAVNNMGDALSSIITIIGTKLAGRAPDKKHPYGYGRIEYLTSGLISVIVIFAGVTSIRESVGNIIHPQAASYTWVTLVIIAAAVAAKFFCGTYVKKVGERVSAQSLKASGSDALFDSFLSLATLLAAAANMMWNISLEGILGFAISIIIVKAGMEMLLETLNSIIGVRTDQELSSRIKETVNSFEQVKGAYDLTIHNYGPSELIGSIHIEVNDTMTAQEIHGLTRCITEKIYNDFGIIMTVGIYASNTLDERVMHIKAYLEQTVSRYPEILEMHGFYAEPDRRQAAFDLVIDFKADASAVMQEVSKHMQERFPDYRFNIVLDSDYSD